MKRIVIFLIVDYLGFAFALLDPAQTDTPAAGGQPGVNSNASGLQEAQRTPGPQAESRRSYYNRYRERPWFDHPDVRSQLGIDDRQYSVLNEAYRSAYSEYRDRLGDLNDLDQARRREKLRQLRQDFDRDVSTSVDGLFTDPARRSRYDQLAYQYQGYNAFNDPAVRRQLNLTPNQRRILSEETRAWNQQMRRLERTYRSNPDLALQQYRELQKKYYNQLGTTLDEQQLRSWNSMIGDRYEFPADSYWDATDTRAARPRSDSSLPPNNRGTEPQTPNS